MASDKGSGDLVGQVRQAIKDAGADLAQLGVACGVEEGALSSFLAGRRDLTLAEAAQVCAALNLALVELAGETGRGGGMSDSGTPPALPSTPPAAALQRQEEATDKKGRLPDSVAQ